MSALTSPFTTPHSGISLSLSLGGGWAHKEVNRMLHNEVCWDLTLGAIPILTS